MLFPKVFDHMGQQQGVERSRPGVRRVTKFFDSEGGQSAISGDGDRVGVVVHADAVAVQVL